MPSIRISQETFDRAKSLMYGRTWDAFLNSNMDTVYGAPGAKPVAANPAVPNYTNNNVQQPALVFDPREPAMIAPGRARHVTHMRYVANARDDPIIMLTKKDAINLAQRLNTEANRIGYVACLDPDTGEWYIQYQPSPSEFKKEIQERADAERTGYAEYLERQKNNRTASQPGCASVKSSHFTT